jgi:hydroxypyruvate isomerase
MTRLAANLTMLFTEAPFLQRFELAARHGFRGVEFLFPYAFGATELAEQLATHRLELVLHNLPAGDWAAGERGIACHPQRVGEFREGVELALEYAQALGVPQLNCLAGIVPDGVSRAQALDTLAANLQFAAARLKQAGLRLLIEPINAYDIPGFVLNRTGEALAVIAATGADNLFLQYDIYHMQRSEGELANTLKQHLALIKHVQLADNPGRGEPGSGEINYAFLFDWLERIGYEGWIGCEYKPRTNTLNGLQWRAQYGLQA